MWHVKEDAGYLWITNGSQSLKIGRKEKSHNIRIANHEVNRRNNSDNVVGIDYSDADIKKIISYVCKKAQYYLEKKENVKVNIQELNNIAHITIWKCVNYP